MSTQPKRSTILGVEHGCTSALDAKLFKDAQANAEGTVTTSHRLFPDAKIFHPSDPELPMSFDSTFRQGMMRSFAKTGLDVQLDFNHLSAGNIFSTPSEQDGAAAGWITNLEDRGTDGLWGNVEWTDSGLNAVRTKKYRYLSPEFAFKQFDKSNGTTSPDPRLYAVALTNRPFLENQQRVAASDVVAHEEGSQMAEKATEDATKLADLVTQVAELQRKLTLSEEGQKVQTIALAEVRKNQRLTAIEAAVATGRVTPALRPSVERFAEACGDDLTQLSTFLSNLPVQVRPKAVGQGAVDTGDGDSLSEADHAMGEWFGVSDADLKKFGDWDTIGLKRDMKIRGAAKGAN